MDIIIQVEQRPYQFDRFHPRCDLSMAICKIMKRQTLKQSELQILADDAGVAVQVLDLEE